MMGPSSVSSQLPPDESASKGEDLEQLLADEEEDLRPRRSQITKRGSFFARQFSVSDNSSPSAMERFSTALASAAASMSHPFSRSSSTASSAPMLEEPPPAVIEPSEGAAAGSSPTQLRSRRPSSSSRSPSPSPRARSPSTPQVTSNCNNTLSVPTAAFGGAIPRRQISRGSSSESNTEAKTCFCGHYSESHLGTVPYSAAAAGGGASSTAVAPSGGRSKPGKCKFCRSRAKYLPGQRSFDAARLFGRRPRERGEPRRAVSEDQRNEAVVDNQRPLASDERGEASASSTTSLDLETSHASAASRRSWRLRPTVKRQARLDLDVPGKNGASGLQQQQPQQQSVSPSRDHGLRTPPGPPVTASALTPLPLRPRRPTVEDDFPILIGGHHRQVVATHMMASDMSGLLAPPSRSGALARAHTDPLSQGSYELPRATPNSPPPSYEEVMKQPRVGPPSYEEALSSRISTLRLGNNSLRSLSEERTSGHPSPPPPFRGRNSSGNLRSSPRPLTRSSRAEEIPDIYWEQAARELDFCTCRKCQARYRQYFEEDLDPGEAMIPIETQVLMQEVLTDGMAFCSLM